MIQTPFDNRHPYTLGLGFVLQYQYEITSLFLKKKANMHAINHRVYQYHTQFHMIQNVNNTLKANNGGNSNDWRFTCPPDPAI